MSALLEVLQASWWKALSMKLKVTELAVLPNHTLRKLNNLTAFQDVNLIESDRKYSKLFLF